MIIIVVILILIYCISECIFQRFSNGTDNQVKTIDHITHSE